MPTAELLKPERLNQYGTLWERGKPQRVTIELARKLENNARFRVTGLHPELIARDLRKPKGAALFQAILAGLEKLDPEDPTCFTRDGDPNWRALNEQLGYDINASDYERALAYQRGEVVNSIRSEDMLPTRADRGDLTSLDVRDPINKRNSVHILKRQSRVKVREKKEEQLRKLNDRKAARDERIVGMPGEVKLTSAELAAQEQANLERQRASMEESLDDVPDLPGHEGDHPEHVVGDADGVDVGEQEEETTEV